MTRTMLILSNVVSAGLLLTAFLVGGHIWPAAIVLLFFGFWIYTFIRCWTWTSTLYLFLTFGLIAAGFFMDLEPAALFPAAFLSLAGWDLSGLEARLRHVESGEETARLETRHLARLGLVLFIGAALVWLALTVQLTLTFEWIAVLAVFAAWGLGRLVYRLLKGE